MQYPDVRSITEEELTIRQNCGDSAKLHVISQLNAKARQVPIVGYGKELSGCYFDEAAPV
jgi:hypothetical protein